MILPLRLPLHTPRLTLRDLARSDFDAIHAYASDPDVTRFMFHGVRTPDDTREYLDRMMASQRSEPRLIWELGVVVTSTGSLVGACDLTSENGREGDLGFIFSRRGSARRMEEHGPLKGRPDRKVRLKPDTTEVGDQIGA